MDISGRSDVSLERTRGKKNREREIRRTILVLWGLLGRISVQQWCKVPVSEISKCDVCIPVDSGRRRAHTRPLVFAVFMLAHASTPDGADATAPP